MPHALKFTVLRQFESVFGFGGSQQKHKQQINIDLWKWVHYWLAPVFAYLSTNQWQNTIQQQNILLIYLNCLFIACYFQLMEVLWWNDQRSVNWWVRSMAGFSRAEFGGEMRHLIGHRKELQGCDWASGSADRTAEHDLVLYNVHLSQPFPLWEP